MIFCLYKSAQSEYHETVLYPFSSSKFGQVKGCVNIYMKLQMFLNLLIIDQFLKFKKCRNQWNEWIRRGFATEDSLRHYWSKI